MIRNLIHAGVSRSGAAENLHKIYILNWVMLFAMLMNAVIFVVDFYFELYYNAAVNFLLLLIYIPLFYLQSNGKRRTVRNLFSAIMLVVVCYVTFNNYEQGRFTETENILLGAFAMVIITHEKWGKYLLCLLIAGLIIAFKFIKYQYGGLAGSQALVGTLINISLTILSIYFFLQIFHKELSRMFRKVILLNIDLKEQKQKLEENESRLGSINKNKNKLFSIVAHDLRNPIHMLIGLRQVAKSKDLPQDELSKVEEQIDARLETVTNMLDNVLTWAKSQLEGYKIKTQDFGIKSLTDEIVNFYSDSASTKMLSVENEIPVDFMIRSDRDVFDVTLRNIISNALKYSDLYGKIRVYLESHIEGTSLCIQDEGVGMTDKTIQSVLDGELAASEKGTHGEQGTGLGLNLCVELLRLTDCTLAIKSKLGEGTCFTIHIPSEKVKREEPVSILVQ